MSFPILDIELFFFLGQITFMSLALSKTIAKTHSEPCQISRIECFAKLLAPESGLLFLQSPPS